MNSDDIVSKLGNPDIILIGAKTQMKSKAWKCSSCGTLYVSEIEVRIPSPCNNCNGIFFEKLRVE